jgi:hypothetical protein
MNHSRLRLSVLSAATALFSSACVITSVGGGSGGAGGAGATSASTTGVTSAVGAGGSLAGAGKLRGISWNGAAMRESFVELDPATGVLTSLGVLPPQYTTFAQGTDAFDPASNHLFEITGDNVLLVLDAATGALVSAPPLVLGSLLGVMNLEVNNAGELVGLAVPAPSTPWHLVKVNPTTGAVTSISALPPQYSSFGQGIGAFDPATNHLFELTGQNTLLVLDGATGAVVNAAPIVLGGLNGVINLQVNGAGALLGFSWDPAALVWNVVEVDPATGTLTSLATLPPQYDSLVQGLSAFDRAANRIYEIAGKESELIGIDATTGALVSAAPQVLGSVNGILNMEIVP